MSENQSQSSADDKKESGQVKIKCLKTFSSPVLGSGFQGQVIHGVDEERAKKLVKQKLVKIIK